MNNPIVTHRILQLVCALVVTTSCCVGQRVSWHQPQNPVVGEPKQVTVADDFVYVLSEQAVMRTHLNGGGWRDLSAGLPVGTLSSFVLRGSTVFVGTSDGRLYRSRDLGQEWSHVATFSSGAIRQLLWTSVQLAVCTPTRAYLRDSSGAEWRSSVSVTAAMVFATDQDRFFATTDTSIVIYNDSDSTWRTVCARSPAFGIANSLIVRGERLLCGTSRSCIRSTDNGLRWSEIPQLQTHSEQRGELFGLDKLVCAVVGDKSTLDPGIVFRSNDDGASWYRVSPFRGNAQIAVAYQNEVVIVDDDWHVIDVKPIIQDALDLCAIPVKGVLSILAPHQRSGFVVCNKEPLKRLRGMDVWLPVTLPQVVVHDAVYLVDRLIACGEGSHLYYSDDGGLSWFDSSADGLAQTEQWLRIRERDHRLYLESATSGLYCSSDGGFRWINCSDERSLSAVSMRDSLVVAFMADSPGELMYASGYGVSRRRINTGLPPIRSVAICSTGTLLAVDSSGRELYASSDKGYEWSRTVDPFEAKSIHLLAAHENVVIAALQGGGVRLSTNEGHTWSVENLGLVDSIITRIEFNGSTIYLATNTRGLYVGEFGVVLNVENTQSCERPPSLRVLHTDEKLRLRAGSGECDATVYTLQGREVVRGRMGEAQEIDTSSLACGVYIVEYHCHGGREYQPIVIGR